jgi:DNA-binding GntR family transcriptional regulator
MSYQQLNIKIEQPIPIREKIYQHLKNEILSDKIPPNAILVGTKLAKQIGISRTPIREALHGLQKEGLLELIPRVGYRVRQINLEEMKEICEIRKSLEILAARWAIKRITPEEMQSIKENLHKSEIMIEEEELSSFIDLDAEFHRLLAKASGSRRLLKLILTHRSDMLRYRIESFHRTDTVSIAIAGHRQISKCLFEKDENGVESAINDHLEQAKKYIQLYAFEDKARNLSDSDNE